MQHSAEFCISSQFPCAEIGDNGIHEKLCILKVNFACMKNGIYSLQKFPWIIMMRLSKMERERTVSMIHAGTSKSNVNNE